MDDRPAAVVMADAAYDSDRIRRTIRDKGAHAVIPSNTRHEPIKYALDNHLYAQRHLIECCFSKLKQVTRIAARYEKTARNDLAMVAIAATVPWLR